MRRGKTNLVENILLTFLNIFRKFDIFIALYLFLAGAPE
ncbi:hypothetical protein MRBBS_2018 [Marinobacter sp. BSs20148]|jgi:hypothetical protein|nr:hypothetical protein MRBBS_2018 [Marinobacter sp. BSs20148]